MAKKTSANAKAAYARYDSEGRKAKNKAARAVRHAKRHPNDNATSKTKGGRTQDVENRPTKFIASVKRAVAHKMLFGLEVQVKGRDLSTASARKTILTPVAKPSITKKAA